MHTFSIHYSESIHYTWNALAPRCIFCIGVNHKQYIFSCVTIGQKSAIINTSVQVPSTLHQPMSYNGFIDEKIKIQHP